jgi:hypothetical protein
MFASTTVPDGPGGLDLNSIINQVMSSIQPLMTGTAPSQTSNGNAAANANGVSNANAAANPLAQMAQQVSGLVAALSNPQTLNNVVSSMIPQSATPQTAPVPSHAPAPAHVNAHANVSATSLPQVTVSSGQHGMTLPIAPMGSSSVGFLPPITGVQLVVHASPSEFDSLPARMQSLMNSWNSTPVSVPTQTASVTSAASSRPSATVTVTARAATPAEAAPADAGVHANPIANLMMNMTNMLNTMSRQQQQQQGAQSAGPAPAGATYVPR